VAENIRMGGVVSTRERPFERLERSAQFHSFSLARKRTVKTVPPVSGFSAGNFTVCDLSDKW
jgi:hypothetical protein